MGKKKKKEKISYTKEETIEEYLARGGVIQQIDAMEIEDTDNIVKSTVKAPLIPMDLTMGEHYFAERIRRQRKERKFTGDISKLPPPLVEFLKAKGKL
jgi:DNA polymerase III alpha subunit (gram-positive type)